MDSKTVRQKYLDFFKARGHVVIAPAKLIPENDPTTLFTSSGMQPLVPFLLGQTHPAGKRLVDSQPAFRAEDMDEIGDNRHTTCFEMLGNWSLGDYFKEDQLKWYFEFLTDEIGLDPQRLYISVFIGDKENNVPKDTEAAEIWKELFAKQNIDAQEVEIGSVADGNKKGMQGGRIFYYDASKNWWSRSGAPENMPVGEIGGPDSEVFFEYPEIEHNPIYGEFCHPNCDCGRFVEIGNSVFIQYQKQEDGSFQQLSQKNVDFGGGLERTVAAIANSSDIFHTDLYSQIIKAIEEISGKNYSDENNKPPMRIIADHMKAAVFLIAEDVLPANKLQGYILRRLIRRSAVKMRHLTGKINFSLEKVVAAVLDIYDGVYFNKNEILGKVVKVVNDEVERFSKTLEKGLKEIEKIEEIDGKKAFDLYQTFGFPLEVTEELFNQKGQQIDREQFRAEFEKHRELSRTASAGMFKGGLADHSEVTTKYHTTTHLLHQALRDVLGPEVFQKGSNITSERLRFDFSFDRKMTDEEIKKTEEIINQRIKQDLKVDHMIIPIEKAQELNAIGLFNDKYAKEVSIYGVGPGFGKDENSKDQRERGGYYSLEFCGGPHVEHTGVIGKIKIAKEEAISAGIRRIRAVIVA